MKQLSNMNLENPGTSRSEYLSPNVKVLCLKAEPVLCASGVTGTDNGIDETN